jgi:hypothetical protein
VHPRATAIRNIDGKDNTKQEENTTNARIYVRAHAQLAQIGASTCDGDDAGIGDLREERTEENERKKGRKK